MAKSYNGWPASPNRSSIGVVDYYYRGKPFPSGIKSGDVTVVFHYLIDALATRVEDFDGGYGCWGYNYRTNVNNPNSLSCHASGTAIDWRAPKHPNGRGDTWTATQVAEIKKILAELEQTVRWLYNYDEMHFEIRGSVADVKRVANKIRNGTLHNPTPAKEPEMDLSDSAKAYIAQKLNESEAQIMGAIRLEIATAVETITGGRRIRDTDGKVIDRDLNNISEADSYTKLEEGLAAILREIRAKHP